MHNFRKDPTFILHQEDPINGEPPSEKLVGAFITPTELFYVRTHGDIPQIDLHTYRLRIHGLVDRELKLSLEDLRAHFSRKTLAATLECAGNRRQEMAALRPIPGEIPWDAGAIGTAEWSGAPLSEVLLAAGVQRTARHAALLGLDTVEKAGRSQPFGGSIPVSQALRGEAPLAYEMNGAPLEDLHGYPLRLIVPGTIGARSVKWLAAVSLQRHPSENYFYAESYQLIPSGEPTTEGVTAPGIHLGETNVNAAICGVRVTRPVGDHTREVLVEGYALSGGERTIERVELTSDGGRHWTTASLLGDPQPYTWRLWKAVVQVSRGPVELAVRAWDSAANTQPEAIRSILNAKGYLNNAWGRVWLPLDQEPSGE
jgi:sulfite oxidase